MFSSNLTGADGRFLVVSPRLAISRCDGNANIGQLALIQRLFEIKG